jgi:hypothetical protein
MLVEAALLTKEKMVKILASAGIESGGRHAYV